LHWISSLCIDVLCSDLRESVKEYADKLTACESKMAKLQKEADSKKTEINTVAIYFRLC